MNKLTKHRRYQDYVIRDGKLVGEFEEMYRDFDDPWEQSAHEPHALDKTIGLALLRKYGHRRALEYGCGLGHFTAQLNREIGAAAGIDISHTAIRKARADYPDTDFFVGDISDELPISTFKPDVLVFAEITWYVLESLGAFKKLMLAQCAGQGFLHLLTVYPEGLQRYGNDYFTSLDEILAYWSDAVTIKEWGWVSNQEFNGVARTFFYGTIKHG